MMKVRLSSPGIVSEHSLHLAPGIYCVGGLQLGIVE